MDKYLLAMAALEAEARTLANELVERADELVLSVSDPDQQKIRAAGVSSASRAVHSMTSQRAETLREVADEMRQRLLTRRRHTDLPLRWSFTHAELTEALTHVNLVVDTAGPYAGELNAEDTATEIIKALR